MRLPSTLGLLAAVPLLLVAACSMPHPSAMPTASKTTTTTTSASSGNADPLDGANPSTLGCNLGATDLPRAVVPVYMDNGKTRYGTLHVLESTSCNTLWARIENVTLPTASLLLTLARGNLSTGYAANTNGPSISQGSPLSYAVTGMLRIQPGQCIFATATVGDGPMTTTGCIHG